MFLKFIYSRAKFKIISFETVTCNAVLMCTILYFTSRGSWRFRYTDCYNINCYVASSALYSLFSWLEVQDNTSNSRKYNVASLKGVRIACWVIRVMGACKSYCWQQTLAQSDLQLSLLASYGAKMNLPQTWIWQLSLSISAAILLQRHQILQSSQQIASKGGQPTHSENGARRVGKVCYVLLPAVLHGVWGTGEESSFFKIRIKVITVVRNVARLRNIAVTIT